MGESQKCIVKFTTAIVFLMTLLCPIAEAQAGNIFDFFRRDKGKVSEKKRHKEEHLSLPQVYIVEEGDSLSTIARRFYKEVSKWTLIYEANKDKINDPDRIEAGVMLTIPAPKKEKVEVSRIEPLYQQAKEDFIQRNYLAAIAKFTEVIELEKDLYYIYTASAREYIRQAREKIKEREVSEVQALEEKEEKLVRQKEEEKIRLQKAQEQKANIERKAKAENLYRIGKKYYRSKDYSNAACAFGEILILNPEDKNALKYYERCQRKITEEETAQLLAYKQEQRQLRKQKQSDEEDEARARRQVEEKRKREQEEFTERAQEEKLRREAEKRERLAQAELAYEEAEETFLEAKAKFEKAAGLKKDLEASSALKVEEDRDCPASKEGDARLGLSLKNKSKDKEAAASNRIETPGVFEYTIGEGDTLYIYIWQEEDLNQEVVVRPDGKISFSLAGDLPAAGLTFAELKDELTQRLKEYIKYPVVSVSLKQLGGKKVIILGEVRSPGVYSVTGKSTALEAIGKAGGFTPDAVSASTILIKGGLQNPQGRRLNLKRAVTKADMSQNVILQAEDIVYVPKKFIANLNYTLSQILGPISQGAGASKNIQDW